MNTSVTGPKNWANIHYLCDAYDAGTITDSQNLYRFIQKLPYCYSCFYCRQSLGPFLDKMDNQFIDALENGKMRRFGYSLHNRVNNKLFDQEDARLQERLEEKRKIWNRDFTHLQNRSSPKSSDDIYMSHDENKFWEEIWYELSCILYTKLPPTYEEFLQRPQFRNEDTVWKSLSCFAHGYTLNETAKPVHYDELITSLLTLYWPEIMHDPEFRLQIDAILKQPVNKMTYLKKVWLLRRQIFQCTKEIHKAALRKLLVGNTDKYGVQWTQKIYIDDIRSLNLQHKKNYEQTFESLEAEMKSYESNCKNNTCRPTAEIELL
jgi:hypothetical protein